ncbi:MAG: response regulator [Acidimicrobiales bacterium]
MVTVVVCDDDAFLRQNVSELCEEAGLTVVAETDRGTDALELVKRFDVDVLLLDLALPDGSGERALEALRDVESQPVVIVLTAYAEDPDRLVRLGAREVIEKPNFSRLEAVLAQLASTAARPPRSMDGIDERRRTTRPVPEAPEIWRSPSGICSSHDLVQTLRGTVEGDAILLILTRGLEQVERDVGPTLAADCRLRSAGLLRDTLRVQDVVHEVPEVDGFAAVLRGGDAGAAEAAWNRLVVLVAASRVPGELCGAHTRIDGNGGEAGMARLIEAVGSAASDVRGLISG